MRAEKYIVLVMVLIFLIISLLGCSQEKSTAKEISPINKDEIKVMSISYGNSVTKEFTDKEQINTLIELLESIKFSKIDIKQEEKVFDKGKIFQLNTTFVIQLAKYQQGISEADIIVISEQELILADSETMRNSRTVSYMNGSDEASLNAVNKIYSLAKEAMD